MVKDYRDLIRRILGILREFDEGALKEVIAEMWPHGIGLYK